MKNPTLRSRINLDEIESELQGMNSQGLLSESGAYLLGAISAIKQA